MALWKYGLAISIADKKGKSGNETCYLLTAKTISLGRGEENAIRLRNDAVSTLHCELTRKTGEGGFTLTDLGSTNGTVLNGEDLEKGDARDLRDGDALIIGLHVTARFFRMKEIGAPKKKEKPAKLAGGVTQKLAKPPAINPVAAAVARAEKR